SPLNLGGFRTGLFKCLGIGKLYSGKPLFTFCYIWIAKLSGTGIAGFCLHCFRGKGRSGRMVYLYSNLVCSVTSGNRRFNSFGQATAKAKVIGAKSGKLSRSLKVSSLYFCVLFDKTTFEPNLGFLKEIRDLWLSI